jgi:hypothetical protein
MRGFGDYHRALVAEHGDPRLLELFGHLRRALDTFEQIMLRRPVPKTKPQPQATPEKPAAASAGTQTSIAVPVNAVSNSAMNASVRLCTGVQFGC